MKASPIKLGHKVTCKGKDLQVTIGVAKITKNSLGNDKFMCIHCWEWIDVYKPKAVKDKKEEV